MNQLIECVPNFSEGNNPEIIAQITQAIKNTNGVLLLDTDPGKATNRTVVTFVGTPQAVVNAAFMAIKKASELINMAHHKGEHPRMGATDVCPLIPISNITMQETAQYAHQLAQRVANELHIPIYMYENAATNPTRKNLADIRQGEYEALPTKLTDPQWTPDYGKPEWNEHTARTGATVIGARPFLIAYNVNINSTAVRRANAIAFDVREMGRELNNGKRKPGMLKHVKGIGWYIPEYGVAQISMNLTNIDETPLHAAFEACCQSAHERGMRVTGSELVGLVPLQAMLQAGKFFLKKQKRSAGVSEKELIHIAVKSLGLNDLAPFEPRKKIIEYVLQDAENSTTPLLINQTLTEFANETASESPAPGGGSISAYTGALAAALAAMVANLSAHKKGWENEWEFFSDCAEQAQIVKQHLLKAVDDDTQAFNAIMNAFALPKTNPQARLQAIEQATLQAIKVPFEVMQQAYKALQLNELMANKGNPNSVSDAGVGALCSLTALHGAFLNVKINAQNLKNNTTATNMVQQAEYLLQSAQNLQKQILETVNQKIDA